MPRRNPNRNPTAPRLPRYSPTRIALYLFCPRAYRFYYDRGLKWGGATAGNTFGGNLHRVLQHFHERGGPAEISAEELIAELRNRWTTAGFASAAEAETELATGEAVLLQYYQSALEAGRVTLWTEKTVQHRYEDFVLFGKVDRLDRRADGSLEIVDYKSGRRTVSEDEVRSSLALKIYQLLVARMHPGVPVHTGIHCLRSGQCVTVKRSNTELEELEREIIEIVHSIMTDREMTARPGEQCRTCVYPRICPLGRDWLRRHEVTDDAA